MSHSMIYHRLRIELLTYRRACLVNKMSEDEADSAFDTAYRRLVHEYGASLVNPVHDQFEADLALMGKLEWLEQAGPAGLVIAHLVLWITSEEQTIRVVRLWRELVTLDEEVELLDGGT